MSVNPDSVLEELNAFDSCENKDQILSPALEEYLMKIAKTGNILFPWCKLKPVLKHKIDQVLVEFCKSCPVDSIPSLPNTETFSYDALRQNIIEAVDAFDSAPFTIQRVCELITNPRKHYNRTDKYMRGLEKNLLVVTTVEPKQDGENDGEAAKNQPAMVNGISADSSISEHSYENDCESTGLPPVNGTVLENFATVFPSAPHISNPPNNIQVAIVTDTDTYQATQAISTFSYCPENSDEGFHDSTESSMSYETNGTTYCEPETGEKYIIIEELNVQEMNCETENGNFENGTSDDCEQQCPVPCENGASSSVCQEDSEEILEEPDRKRLKVEIDSQECSENVTDSGEVADSSAADESEMSVADESEMSKEEMNDNVEDSTEELSKTTSILPVEPENETGTKETEESCNQ